MKRWTSMSPVVGVVVQQEVRQIVNQSKYESSGLADCLNKAFVKRHHREFCSNQTFHPQGRHGMRRVISSPPNR